MNRFDVLDSFRGLSALCVVMFHLHIIGSVAELSFFRNSGVFVDFFFVLSGFVLAHGYGFRENISFRDFILARVFRLYPLHVFMLVVFICLEFIKLVAFNLDLVVFTNSPFTGVNSPAELLANSLLIHAWTPYTSSGSFNAPSWSISIEFYTYMIFYLTLIVSSSWKIAFWALIPILVIFLKFFEVNSITTQALGGLICFFSGVITYVVYLKVMHVKLGKGVGSFVETLLLIIVICVVAYSFEHKKMVLNLVFCSIVLCFAFESGWLSGVLRLNFFHRIGQLSYSIYMIHAALIFVLLTVMMVLQKLMAVSLLSSLDEQIVVGTGNIFVDNLILLVFMIVVISLSHYTHKYVELRWKRKGKKSQQQELGVCG